VVELEHERAYEREYEYEHEHKFEHEFENDPGRARASFLDASWGVSSK
jgi:hypothetical protein